VVMLPWWIRNARVTGHFVATTLQVGASLYDGWNPEADGGSKMDFVQRFEQQEREIEAKGAERAGSDSFEYRLDRRMGREAAAWAWAHPLRVAQLAWVKVTRLWNIWPNEPALRGWAIRLAVLGTYGPLSCLGLAGIWRYAPRGWPYVLACLPAVYFTLLHAVFVSSIRYREPAMLALLPLAAGALLGVRFSKQVGAGQGSQPTRALKEGMV